MNKATFAQRFQEATGCTGVELHPVYRNGLKIDVDCYRNGEWVGRAIPVSTGSLVYSKTHLLAAIDAVGRVKEEGHEG